MTHIIIRQGTQLPIPKGASWKMECSIRMWNSSNRWMEITEECTHPLEESQSLSKYLTSYPTRTCNCEESLLDKIYERETINRG